MSRQLSAAVPGEGSYDTERQVPERRHERVGDGDGILPGHPDKNREPRATFYQRRNMRVGGAGDEVSLPVAELLARLNVWRTLGDRHRTNNLASVLP